MTRASTKKKGEMPRRSARLPTARKRFLRLVSYKTKPRVRVSTPEVRQERRARFHVCAAEEPPKHKRRCSNCRENGHYAPTCPKACLICDSDNHYLYRCPYMRRKCDTCETTCRYCDSDAHCLCACVSALSAYASHARRCANTRSQLE